MPDAGAVMDSESKANNERDCGLIIEKENDGQQVDVVAVHGLHGGRRQSWTLEDDANECWLPKVFSGRVMLYGYDKDIRSFIGKRRNIIREAKKLLESLRELRKGNELSDRPVIFVSHGLGGLIVKAAIVIASRDSAAHEYLVPAVRVLVFYDFPHMPTGTGWLKRQLQTHISEATGLALDTGELFDASHVLAETIEEVNGMFMHSKMTVQARIINYFSDEKFSGSDFKGFGPRATAMKSSFGFNRSVDRRHKSITRLSVDEVSSFQSEAEKWIRKKISGTPQEGQNNDKSVQEFASQASPLFPHANSVTPVGLIPDLRKLLDSTSSMVLHVQNASDGSNPLLFDSILSFLDSEGSHTVFGFPFNKHDGRFSSIDKWLYTVVSRHLYEEITEECTDVTAIFVSLFPAFLTKDLFYYLKRTVPDIYSDVGPIIYVLDGLDRCSNGISDFFQWVKDIMKSEEYLVKFVITTSLDTSDHLLSEFSRMPGDCYMSSVLAQKEEFMGTCAPYLLKDRAGLNPTTVGILDELDSVIADDSTLLPLIQKWLDQDRRALGAVESDLQKLKGASPGQIFALLLSNMPSERHDWARAILLWVLLAYRSLLVEELCLVSHFLRSSEKQNSRPESVQQILGYFGGILQNYHGEIRFGHPGIRTWLDSCMAEPELDSSLPPQAWWQQIETGEKGHAEILRTCLCCLTTNPQELSCFTDWPSAHPFPYAAAYWPSHYKIARNSPLIVAARTLAIALLQQESLRLPWVKSYSLSTHHLVRPGSDDLDPVAIATNLGLEDLVEILDGDGSDQRITHAVSVNMVEAAKRGNIRLLRKFLPAPPVRFRLEDGRLYSLIWAAATSGRDEVVVEIMKYIPDAPMEGSDPPGWVSSLLFLAIWIGSEALVGRLLDLGANPAGAFKTNFVFDTFFGPVGLACMRNAIGIINLFIDRGYDITPVTGIEQPTLVSSLAAWSRPEVIRLLFANGFQPKTLDRFNQTVLHRAAEWGRYEAIETLLELAELGQYLREDVRHPLNITTRNGFPKSTEVILKRCADPNMSDDGSHALKCAILSGNWQVCQQLLDHPSIDVNNTGTDGKAPLLVAIGEKWQNNMIKALLDRGANMEFCEAEGWNRTCLLVAAANSAPDIEEVIRTLLDRGANIKVHDSDGWSVLFTAASYSTPEIVQRLIDAGCDVSEACGVEQYTPLHAAAANSRADIVAVLLAQGLDPSIKGSAGFSPLEIAAKSSAPEAVKLMLGIQLEDKVALSASLRWAVQGDDEKSVRMLLDAGADVNYNADTDEADNFTHKTSILGAAVYRGNESIVRMLLEFRPDVDAQDADGNGLLHCVSSKTPVTVVKLLVNAGARLDSTNNKRHTPLFVAGRVSNWDVFHYLLSKKETRLTLNVASTTMGAILHLICRLELSNNLELIRLLVDNGADVNLDCAGDRIGTPLFQCCVRLGDNYAPEKEEMVRYLIEKKAKIDSMHESASPIHFASMCCSVNIIKMLLAKGANPDAVDNLQRRPLHLACYNSLAALEAVAPITEEKEDQHCGPFLNVGARHDFSLKDVFGRVPLHYAVATGDIALIRFVLEQSLVAGLTVDVADYDGWTPLMWTARDADLYEWGDDVRDRRAAEVVQLLLDCGANAAARGHVPAVMSAPGNNEWTAIDVAQYHGSLQVIEVLEKSGAVMTSLGQSRSPKIGEYTLANCDGCELELRGIFHMCQNCANFVLCFKCYGYYEKFHPPHDFIQKGSHTEVEEEKAEEARSAASSNGHEDELDLDSDVISDEEVS